MRGIDCLVATLLAMTERAAIGAGSFLARLLAANRYASLARSTTVTCDDHHNQKGPQRKRRA
jgi:hypothetical protein